MTATETNTSDYAAPFWRGCERGELLVQYCGHCDRRISPPEPMCPHCIGSELTWIPSKHTGTVYSYSVVHRSPGPNFPTPYVLAVIDMDDGWSLLANVDDRSDLGTVTCGSRVQLSFTAAGDGSGIIPIFRLQPKKGCSSK